MQQPQAHGSLSARFAVCSSRVMQQPQAHGSLSARFAVQSHALNCGHLSNVWF